MKPTSQAQQTMAALKYFGLVEYQGSGENLTATISEDARTYLRAQQDAIKNEVLKRVTGLQAKKHREVLRLVGG